VKAYPAQWRVSWRIYSSGDGGTSETSRDIRLVFDQSI